MKELPKVGFGTWKLDKNNCSELVYEAIKIGYRHIDCACDYGNEKEVGEGIFSAIQNGLCTRDDLWITSKLWNTFHAKQHVKVALKKTLNDLKLDYLDLYLIHFPIAQKYVPIDERYPPEWFFDPAADQPKIELSNISLQETWKAMEELVDEGYVKNIGVCNYNTGLLNDLMTYSRIKPYALQIESHPFLTQEKLIRLAHHYNIHVTAFSPLGSLSYLELNMATPSENILEMVLNRLKMAIEMSLNGTYPPRPASTLCTSVGCSNSSVCGRLFSTLAETVEDAV